MRSIRSLLLAPLLLLSLVSPALASGITVQQAQQRAVEQVNHYRSISGLPAVTAASGLNSAAYGHARYQIMTGEYGHYETHKSSPYYIGYDPSARAARYGYSNSSVTENWVYSGLGSTGTRTYLPVDNAIDWWMSAIYHRYPIISARTENVGYGLYSKPGAAISVLDFGNDYSRPGHLVKWPRPNQRGIGVSTSNEYPNPLARCYGTSAPDTMGYPVSLTWYSGTVSYSSITLTRTSDGKVIEGCRLSPRNDDLTKWSTSLAFVPKAPLSYSTWYTAEFIGTYNGAKFDYKWSFQTMPRLGRLASSVPANGAGGVGLKPAITLRFTRAIRAYTLVRSPYSEISWTGVGASLRDSSGQEVPFTFAPVDGGYTSTVSITPSVNLKPNTRYQLTFTFADTWGRPIHSSTSFTTGS